MHERIGLTPQWYLGAYQLYLSLIFAIMVEEYKGRPKQLHDLSQALLKVVFLDIGLALDAYIEKSNERLEFANRQRAAGLDTLAAVVSAARIRMRPILMTTVATIIGLLPMARTMARFSSRSGRAAVSWPNWYARRASDSSA